MHAVVFVAYATTKLAHVKLSSATFNRKICIEIDQYYTNLEVKHQNKAINYRLTELGQYILAFG